MSVVWMSALVFGTAGFVIRCWLLQPAGPIEQVPFDKFYQFTITDRFCLFTAFLTFFRERNKGEMTFHPTKKRGEDFFSEFFFPKTQFTDLANFRENLELIRSSQFSSHGIGLLLSLLL